MLYIEDVKKIAILRANALGDFLVTLPAIHSIHKAYPEAELILLGKPWHKEFLVPGRSPINRVIVVPVIKGIRDEKGPESDQREIEEFFKAAQKERFDIAIHFQGKGIAANPFLKRLAARVTVGNSSPESENIDRQIPFYYYQSEPIRYLEVAELVGANIQSVEPEIKLLEDDLSEAKQFLNSHTSKPFIVLHVCGTDKRRMWVNERFSELSDAFSKSGYDVIFSGGPTDIPEVERVIAGCKYPAINAAGKLSLGGTAALLSFSALVVGIDTGPLHLARSVGAKTIGLYWAPNFINWGPLTRRNHYPVISWSLQCPRCGIIPNDPYPFLPATNDCDHDFSFIADITVSNVLEASLLLVNS